MNRETAVRSEFYNKTLGCLLGGLIGDAMGTPTENMHYQSIEKHFGWVDDFEGDGTDDTLMKNFLIDALIETDGYATLDDWVSVWLANKDNFYGAKKAKFFISMEHTISKIFKLGLSPRMAGLGNMPSTSVGMCISPVGIVNACNPSAAALQAYNLASLVHIHDVSFCQDGPASMAAAVAEAFRSESTVDTVVGEAINAIIPLSGADMRRRIADVVAIAEKSRDYRAFRSEVYERADEIFPSYPCDARECIPLAFGVFVSARGDFEKTIAYGANLGRDADTIASMAGAVSGAFSGAAGIRADWVDKARAVSARDQEMMAMQLMDAASRKTSAEGEALRRRTCLM